MYKAGETNNKRANAFRYIHIPAQVVQNGHVGIHVIQVIGIRWVVIILPVFRQRTLHIKYMMLRF